MPTLIAGNLFPQYSSDCKYKNIVCKQPITYGEAMNELNDTKIKRYQHLTDRLITYIRNQHQPHVRIEFDDIRDVPKVWVDGELIDELIGVKVDWDTNTNIETHKEFSADYYDLTDERPMRRQLGEGTVI